MKIIIPSFKNYKDAWQPFIKFKEMFWPKCPYKTVLITDFDSEESEGFDQVFSLGKDYGWCGNIYNYLSDNPQDKSVMMIMEDFWINHPVDCDFVTFAHDVVARNKNVGLFRLYPAPAANDSISEEKYGHVRKETPYRISAAQSIWNREFLMKILSGKTDAWDFEFSGTEQADKLDNQIMSTTETFRPMVCIYTAITRGRWTPGALERARELKIYVDTSQREEMK